MIYRRYGRTNLRISVLSLGSMRIPFKIANFTAEGIAQKEKNAVDVLKKALDSGINHIDSARGYGNSEKLIGMGLKEIGRDKFYISTKITAEAPYEQALLYIDEALERLQTDYIDMLNVHGINTENKFSQAMSQNGIIRAIQKAINDGKVGHMGFSSHGSPELITQVILTGQFSAVSLLFSYTYPRNIPAIAAAVEKDMGVLILSPSEKGGLLYKPTPELKNACDPFHPLHLLHRWTLAQKGVTTLAIGAATPEQIALHLPAGNSPEPLTGEETAVINNLMEVEKSRTAGTRCTICYKCMPCPDQVAIPEILRLRNLLKAFNMIDFGKLRYNLLPNGGDWFPGKQADACTICNNCIPRCPENLKIPKLLKETHESLSGEKKGRLWNH